MLAAVLRLTISSNSVVSWIGKPGLVPFRILSTVAGRTLKQSTHVGPAVDVQAARDAYSRNGYTAGSLLFIRAVTISVRLLIRRDFSRHDHSIRPCRLQLFQGWADVGAAAHLENLKADPQDLRRAPEVIELRSEHRVADIAQNTGTRAGSFCSSSRRLPSRSTFWVDRPVTFPPGRPRLATSSTLTGSAIPPITIGTVVVARLAARDAGVPRVAISSTGRLINWAASSG